MLPEEVATVFFTTAEAYYHCLNSTAGRGSANGVALCLKPFAAFP